MSKDYKNINSRTKKAKKSTVTLSNLLSLITGLSIGLLVAFYMYLQGQQNFGFHTVGKSGDKDEAKQTRTEKPVARDGTNNSLPKPNFDFYKILPDREVNISEWIAESQDKGKTEIDEANMYVFQVGSFKDYEAADQVKAQLALLGISADIQRVVINGQDSRHRVRVGPFRDPAKLRKTRERLEENNLEFMLLKLQNQGSHER